MKNTALKGIEFENHELQTDQLDKYLTFHLDKEDFAIPIHFVTEIVGIQAITKVPDMPPFMRGIINLRGLVIPVMDVRLRFGLDERGFDERTCIIVVNVQSKQVGLIVDLVKEVMDIPSGQVQPVAELDCSANHFVQGLGKVGQEVKILLDVECLVGCEESLS